MIALSLTIFVSLGLAVFFIGLFLIQIREAGGRPHDALLPMEEEKSVVTPAVPALERRGR